MLACVGRPVLHTRTPIARRRAGGWCVLLLLAIVSSPLHAASCRGDGSLFAALPTYIEFSAKDVGLNQALTPWLDIDGGAVTQDFNCSSSVGVSYRAISHGGFVADRYVESGAQFMVYPTGAQGVGMAFLVESPLAAPGKPSALGFDEIELYSGQSVAKVGARIRAKLIRTGTVRSGRNLTSSTMVIQTRLYEGGASEPLRRDIFISPTTLNVSDPPRCRMQTREVKMGTVSLGSFGGVGSHAGQRPYELALECEAGVGQVDYQVVPTTAVINSEQGLAEASGGVAGVAYQFLNGDGSPMRFYSTELFGHGSSSALILRKTFGVRYQQTLPTITPGPANAGLMFSLTFP